MNHDALTEEQKEVLRNSITIQDQNIIVWHEAPVATVAGLEVHKEKIASLLKGLDHYYFLIDVSKSSRPSPEFIEALKKYMSDVLNPGGMRHASLNVGNNLITKYAVKYMGKRMGFLSYSVHTSPEEAMQELKNRKAADLKVHE